MQKTETKRLRPGDMLDQRYGAIGISAVAAAVRYQSDGKDVPLADESRKDDKAAA
jgi:hypothetical protein